MIGEFVELISTAPYAESFSQRSIKADRIAEVILRMPLEAVYVETSHMFIKTFFDVALDRFRHAEVIILRRKLVRVLKSFIELGYFHPQEINPAAKHWMSRPDALTAAFPLHRPLETMDQFERCIAYLIDIEARALRFQHDFPSVPVHQIKLEDILTIEGARDLFSGLLLTPTESTWNLAGEQINDRSERKQLINNPTTIDECCRRLEKYVAEVQAAGLTVPSSMLA